MYSTPAIPSFCCQEAVSSVDIKYCFWRILAVWIFSHGCKILTSSSWPHWSTFLFGRTKPHCLQLQDFWRSCEFLIFLFVVRGTGTPLGVLSLVCCILFGTHHQLLFINLWEQCSKEAAGTFDLCGQRHGVHLRSVHCHWTWDYIFGSCWSAVSYQTPQCWISDLVGPPSPLCHYKLGPLSSVAVTTEEQNLCFRRQITKVCGNFLELKARRVMQAFLFSCSSISPRIYVQTPGICHSGWLWYHDMHTNCYDTLSP